MIDSTLRDWIARAQRACDMTVAPISWAQSREWQLTHCDLRHQNGGFFRVIGITSKEDPLISQPIIDQPEIGILGFLIRHNTCEAEFLVQAKAEPGNVRLVQISPSVQATQSNYERRHGGRETPCLQYFTRADEDKTVTNILQSEQGTRFLGKYNRNMVVEVDCDLEPDVDGNLHWFASSTLRELLVKDYYVNTDARSVLASAPWTTIAANKHPYSCWHGRDGFGAELLRSYEAKASLCETPDQDLLGRLEDQRALNAGATEVIDLADIKGWKITEDAIRSKNGADFDVRPFAVVTTQREVTSWDQPLAVGLRTGNVELFCQRRRGIMHFLFDARFEPGFREAVQYGPTWEDDGWSFLMDADFGSSIRDQSRVVLSCMQSDEGGRFYRSVARYAIRQLPDGCEIDPHSRLSWMTLAQVERLVKYQGVFTNEARSLISMLLRYA